MGCGRGCSRGGRLALAEDTLSIVCGAHDGFGKSWNRNLWFDRCMHRYFRRDPTLSSTNSVLVTIAASLETALLCPMLGGYDTIVEQAPPAPEEPVGGPISALVAPISVSAATIRNIHALPIALLPSIQTFVPWTTI